MVPQRAWWGEHALTIFTGAAVNSSVKTTRTLSPDFPPGDQRLKFSRQQTTKTHLWKTECEQPQTNETASAQRLTNRADAPKYYLCLKMKN